MGATADGLLAQISFDLAIRPDGWVHLAIGPQGDVLRGPVGVLGYLLFVPLIWWMPKRALARYLFVTSLAWALVTLGPAYVGLLATLVIGGWIIVAWTARAGSTRFVPLGVLVLVYVGLLIWPQPPPLPTVAKPLYFYLHWAGLGYFFLKLYHAAVDTAHGSLTRPTLTEFAAYLLFAPTLRMGPIYRAQDFLDQLHHHPPRFSAAVIGPAIGRVLLGLVRWGVLVRLQERFPPDVLFGSPGSLPTWKLLVGVYAQPISIFLWISGYVDVAVGMGRLMGFAVPENFDYPWISRSVREFWRRWHLTLGFWLRDYIFIPLGGSRRRVYFNYVVTFGFIGFWHGLYLSYIVWGFTQAAGLCAARLWTLRWARERECQSPAYQWMRRLRLIDSKLADGIAWLLTFHYQILTIAVFMDENFVGRRFLPEIASRMFSASTG